MIILAAAREKESPMSDRIVEGLSPPYCAVIFTSRRTVGDDDADRRTADAMLDLAARQPEYPGVETAHAGRTGDDRLLLGKPRSDRKLEARGRAS
jgi:hypothetical protein